MKAITVNELWKACVAERKKGNGNKTILVSADDEGNEFHPMYFLFTPMDDNFKDSIYGVENPDDCVILG